MAETGQPYAYTGDDPVNGVDPSGLCWSLAPGFAGPCPPPPDGVPYGGSFTTDEVAQYPQVLAGMNPDEFIEALGGVPPGFSVQPGQSASLGQGPGWKLTTQDDGGYQFRWSPGSARPDHPDNPYWRVSSGEYGKSPDRIPGGDWPDGPSEYTNPPAPRAGGDSDSGGDPCITSYQSGIGGPQLLGCDLTGPGEFGGDGDGDDVTDPSFNPFEFLSYTLGSECNADAPVWDLQ